MPAQKAIDRALARRLAAMPPILTTREICTLFGISRSTVARAPARRWRDLPRPLPRRKNAPMRWVRESVRKWLEQRQPGAAPDPTPTPAEARRVAKAAAPTRSTAARWPRVGDAA